jgi:hypothetical protein
VGADIYLIFTGQKGWPCYPSFLLNSERAILVNIQIMRTFTRLRDALVSHEELRRKLEQMGKKYDRSLKPSGSLWLRRKPQNEKSASISKRNRLDMVGKGFGKGVGIDFTRWMCLKLFAY